MALGAILTLATGSGTNAAVFVAEPAPTPVPVNPTPVGDDGVENPHWTDDLLTLLTMLCMLLGCGDASQNAGGPELSAAINRLSLSVLGGGVPLLSDKDRTDALNAALEAAVITEAHADGMSVNDYATLTFTLDAIVAELARGQPK